jgi:hypothetical protein
VSKGVSEKFDEQEHDTARRDYPEEIVDGSRRTMKMSAIDLDGLRTQSGTRPALGPEAIDRHVRDRMDVAFAAHLPTSGFEEDAHSRPTIEAGVLGAIPGSHDAAFVVSSAIGATAVPPRDPFAPPSRPTPLSAVFSEPYALEPRRSSSIAGWVVAAVIVGVLMMVSAAGAVGFVLGRRSAGR